MGAAIGTIKNNSKAIIAAFVSWLCFTFFFPILINNQVSAEATSNTKSLYSHEMQKLDVLLNHLNLVSKEISNLQSMQEKIEAVKKWNEIYWNSTFKKIERLESDMMTGIKRHSERLHLLNTFTPINFYSSVNNEISSRGYNFLVDFYKYVQGKQKGFVRYYIDHIFDDYSKIEPFMTKDDYVFQAKPSLPKYFWLGLVLNLGYILLAGWLSYRCFINLVFPKVKDKKMFEGAEVGLPEVSYLMCKYRFEEVPEQLFNILSGKKLGFTGKIVLNWKNFIFSGKQDFVYVPDPTAFPGDVRVKSLLNMAGNLSKFTKEDKTQMRSEASDIIDKRFNDLNSIQKVDLLYNLAKFKKSPIYLLHNLFIEAEKEDADRVCSDMKSRAELVIEMDSQKVSSHSNYDRRIFFLKRGSGYTIEIMR
jgi:hypothetical protein